MVVVELIQIRTWGRGCIIFLARPPKLKSYKSFTDIPTLGLGLAHNLQIAGAGQGMLTIAKLTIQVLIMHCKIPPLLISNGHFQTLGTNESGGFTLFCFKYRARWQHFRGSD